MTTAKKNNLIPICIIVVFTFILYGNSIKNRFSLDDDFVTANNTIIQKGLKGIPKIFTSFYTERESLIYGYRPIVKTSYAIEYQIFGENPYISHFINVLLYALTGLLLFNILKKLLKNYSTDDRTLNTNIKQISFPLAITLLFLAHPIHTEVVCSLKNRDELLSFLFCLIALHFFIKYSENAKAHPQPPDKSGQVLPSEGASFSSTNWGGQDVAVRFQYILYGMLSYLLAYLSKSSALVFLVIIPLFIYFFTVTPPKKILIIFLSILIIVIICRYGPKLYLPHPDRTKSFFENPLFFDKNIWTRISTGFYTLIYYIKLLFFPHPLRFYYGYNMIPIVNIKNIWVILSFVFHLCIFVYAILTFRKKSVLSFAILYYLICVSMFSNIVKPAMGIVAERYIYSASLGFCIIIIYFISLLSKSITHNKFNNKIPSPRFQTLFFILLIAILIPYSTKTITRNKVWKDRLTLYSHDIKYLENSVKANDLLASELVKQANIDKDFSKINLAIKYYKQAYKIDSTFYSALNNLGLIYFVNFQNYALALKYFKKAVEINPEYAKGYYNLAMTYEKLKNYDEAIKNYKKASEFDNRDINILSNLANIYNAKGNFEEAVKLNEEMMKIDSTSDKPYINIGNYYLLKNDTATAVKYWEKAIEKVPYNYNLCNGLYRYFRQKGDLKKSDYYYKKVLEAQKYLPVNQR